MAKGDDKDVRRRIAQAQIRQFPDPVLRSETHPIEAFDDDLRALADRMFELAEDAIGRSEEHTSELQSH